MSYNLHPSESLDDGFRRILAEEIERTQTLLRNTNVPIAKAVHNARRSFKKKRALLRLVGPAISPEPYQTLNRTFRDWGRSLSASRDAFVVTQTMDMLLQRYESYLKKEPILTIRNYLQEQYKKSRHEHPLKRKDLNHLAAQMPDVMNLLDHQFDISDRFAVLGGGLEKTYKAGLNAFRKACDHKEAPLFHEWRKQTKYLWHQHQLLTLYWPVVIDAYSDEYHRLTELLSDEHDLFVLHERLTQDDMHQMYKSYKDPLDCCIHDQQDALRRSAIEKGRLLFSETPEMFVNRLHQYWNYGRKTYDISENPNAN